MELGIVGSGVLSFAIAVIWSDGTSCGHTHGRETRDVTFLYTHKMEAARLPIYQNVTSQKTNCGSHYCKNLFLIEWLFSSWVWALAVPVHLGLKNGPFVPHNLVSGRGSPIPLQKFQMEPREPKISPIWTFRLYFPTCIITLCILMLCFVLLL